MAKPQSRPPTCFLSDGKRQRLIGWSASLQCRFRVSGRERIPRTGTYVVIGNHLGWLDALTFLIVFPLEPRIHFLADPTGMMRRRLEWALIRATGGIVPVDRAVRNDTRLFRHVFRCLELGGAIALFPEGDMGPKEGELQPFKKGFAHFAVGAGVPVVPVVILAVVAVLTLLGGHLFHIAWVPVVAIIVVRLLAGGRGGRGRREARDGRPPR